MSPVAAAAYIRASSESQDFAMQRDAIKRAMKARGDRAAPALWFEEKKSGGTMERPALSKLRARVRAGDVSRLYVFHVDRLARTGIVDMLSIVRELWSCGAELVSVNGPFDLPRGPIGELVLSVLAFGAQFELDRNRARLKEARARIERAGGRWGRPSQVSPSTLRRARDLRKTKTLRQVAAALKVPRATLADALAGKGHYAKRHVTGSRVAARRAGVLSEKGATKNGTSSSRKKRASSAGRKA